MNNIPKWIKEVYRFRLILGRYLGRVCINTITHEAISIQGPYENHAEEYRNDNLIPLQEFIDKLNRKQE